MKEEEKDLTPQEDPVAAAEEPVAEQTEDQKKIEELTGQLAEARKQSEDYLDRLRRSMAEFDNYRKRTEKEKEQERTKGILEVVSAVLPLLDNFERALASIPEEEKERRKDILMELQQRISSEKSQEMVGESLEVIIEGQIPGEEEEEGTKVYSARTYRDAPDIDGFLFLSSSQEYLS